MIEAIRPPEKIPVTSNGIPVRNLWYMLSYSWRNRRLLNRWRTDVESAPTLDGLLARILMNLVNQRSRVGLGRNYRPEERTLAGIRGRVDFATSLKKLTFQNGRAHCRFQIFDANVLKNQIIRSTLNWVAVKGDFGDDANLDRRLRQEIRHLVRQLSHIDLIELQLSAVKRQKLERDDYDYRLMLTICHLLLSDLMPLEDEGDEQSSKVDRDWKFVWRLFESFVANFYKVHLYDWSVRSQKTLKWPTEGDSSFLPVMKPDLLMRHKLTKQNVVLDTKLTKNCLTSGQFENKAFNPAHVYQLYAYIRSHAKRLNKPMGVLLYPAVHFKLSDAVKVHGQQMRWETIDLAQQWQQIERDLISLAESFVEPSNDLQHA